MVQPSFMPVLAAPQLPPLLAEVLVDGDPETSTCDLGAVSSCGTPAPVSSAGAPPTPPLKAHIGVHVQTSANAPVSGVDVKVTELGLNGITDAKGNWDFGDVDPGSYTVTGMKDGCVP